MQNALKKFYPVSGKTPEEILEGLSFLQDPGHTSPEHAKHCWEAFSVQDPLRMILHIKEDTDVPSLREKALCVLSAKEDVFEENLFFTNSRKPGKIAFLFPGQGSQYPGMGKELCGTFPEMRSAVELADEAFRQNAAPHRKNTALSASIYPEGDNTKEHDETLRSTDLAQCAIGCVSLGMARILENLGVCPDALCGHSYGELPALCSAHVFSPEDCFALSVLRGKFMAGDPDDPKDRGGMMAVRADMEQIRAILEKEKLAVVLANENSPSQCVLSGSGDALNQAAALLKTYKIRGVRLPVAAAFHSPLVESAALPFKKVLGEISFCKPALSVMSNAEGAFYPENPEEIREILARQLLSPVRFVRNIEGLFNAGVRTFIEVGPKNVLTGLAASILEGKPDVHCMAMDASSGKNSGKTDLAILLAKLIVLGYPLSVKDLF